MSRLAKPRKRGATKIEKEALTVQQKRFVEELLNDEQFRPSVAAKKAKYAQPGTAGTRLMTNKTIAAYIGKELYERSQRMQVTAEHVLRALSNIAFVDIRKAFNDDGSIKLVTDMDEHTAFAVEAVEVTERTDDYGRTVRTSKLKMNSKLGALELIAKHLGMLDARLKVDHSGSVDIVGHLLSQVNAVAEDRGIVDGDFVRLEAEKT